MHGLLLALASLLPARGGELVLAAKGEERCTIVVAPGADPAERHAADELAHFLSEIT